MMISSQFHPSSSTCLIMRKSIRRWSYLGNGCGGTELRFYRQMEKTLPRPFSPSCSRSLLGHMEEDISQRKDHCCLRQRRKAWQLYGKFHLNQQPTADTIRSDLRKEKVGRFCLFRHILLKKKLKTWKLTSGPMSSPPLLKLGNTYATDF